MKISHVFILLLITLMSCNEQESKKLMFQPNSELGKDVVISEAYGNRNYADLDKIHLLSLSVQDTIDNDSRFLLRFGFSTVPEAATIDSAFVYLNAIEPGHFGEKNSFLVKRIKDAWINKEVTWDTQPDTDSKSIAVLSAPADNMQNYRIDVTEYVKKVVAKEYANNGFLFELESEEKPYKGIRFKSSNFKDEAARPKLEVYYRE